MKNFIRAVAASISAVAISGCAFVAEPSDVLFEDNARLMRANSTGLTLERLPAPSRAIDVAVYSFPDRTGQNETNDNLSLLSRAVTQGGADILTDVVDSAGAGKWFNVIERARVESLLRERAIIEQTQTAFTGQTSLPPLRFAGTLIEGSIVGYDTNQVTGGAGARFLGIGAFTEYREDIVTIALRSVSVSSGRVLTSVTTTKTVYSVKAQGDVFRFVAVDEILELEAGFSRNEPEIFATREAMELAVMATIVEGAQEGHWHFADRAAGQEFMDEFHNRYELARLGYTPGQIYEIQAEEEAAKKAAEEAATGELATKEVLIVEEETPTLNDAVAAWPINDPYAIEVNRYSR